MMPKEEVIKWLQSLPAGSEVFIDEGGLTLRCDSNPEAHLEVGGSLQDVDYDMDEFEDDFEEVNEDEEDR
jgi:hypothetical protein